MKGDKMGIIRANDGRTAKHAYTYAGVSVVVGICIMVLILGSYVGFPGLCMGTRGLIMDTGVDSWS